MTYSVLFMRKRVDALDNFLMRWGGMAVAQRGQAAQRMTAFATGKIGTF